MRKETFYLFVSIVILYPAWANASHEFQQVVYNDSSTVWLDTGECAIDVRNGWVGVQFCVGQKLGSVSNWPGGQKLQTVNLPNGDCGAANYGYGSMRWYCARPLQESVLHQAATEEAETSSPVDLDHDGVADAKDLCPDTPADIEVTVLGCDKTEDPVLHGINFATASWELAEDSKRILETVAEKLSQQDAQRIEIRGHTDSAGASYYNKRLSQLRAQAVARYLVALGLNPNYLEARGYGEDHPIASNKTAEGRSINRRVTIKLLQDQ